MNSIGRGVNDTRTPLIDFENLNGWQVTQNDAVGVFSISREEQIWGEHVGKLVYRSAGTHPVVKITPPAPVSLEMPLDCVNLWVYGNNWGWVPDRTTPQVEIRVLLENSQGTVLPIVLGRVRWKEWWLMHRRLTTEQLQQLGDHPRFVGLEVRDGRNRDDRTIYFDNLAIYRESLPPLSFEPRRRRGIELPEGQTVGNNVGPGQLPFPTRDETILPDNLTDKYQVSVEESAGAYLFHYLGDDGSLTYRYQPESGTLSDVTAQWQGRTEVLRPLDGGEVLFAPATNADAVVPEWRELISCQRDGDAVRATWHCRLGQQSSQVTYTIRLWQKSLVVDVQCQEPNIGEFRLGRVAGAVDPRIVTVPYLTGAEQRPAILVSGTAEQPLFVSALLDHCRSNSSLFWFTNQVAPEGTTINGGARYLPRTDRKRNRCFERVFLTISPRFEEVLPNIPNPKSPWMHVTGERVWRAHGATNRQHDYEYWQKVARYGMTKVVITDHETGWRDGGESFTMRTRAAPGKGGDESQAEYARKLHALGFRYGIYNNYTDFAPVNGHWDEDYVTRTPDNQWQTAWPRCYNPKPARAVELESQLAPIIQQKFQLDTAYCDVHTAVRPWSYVDFDARVPGAGTFAATFYAYGEIMLHQKKTWQGPVYSEGNNHWYYCGLTDGNYGQDQVGQLATSPWLVDFDLRKMHPLCCNFGMGNLGMFYGNERAAGKTPTERQARLDRFLAATLAFGHTGFLVFEGGFANAVQSYYAVQQVHSRYAQQTVESIRYADHQGRLLDTSQAVASDAFRRCQIVTRYDNGLEVSVNGNTTDDWSLPSAQLPPNGWYVEDTAQHRLTAYSAIVDGHRADYVDSPAYVYANGRGTLTRFARATCDGQMIANWLPDGNVEVIPVEDCHVCGIQLPGQSATAVALDEQRRPLGPATTRLSRGKVYITPVPHALSYLLTPTDPPAGPLRCSRVNAIVGETLAIDGSTSLQYVVPADAVVGDQLWFESEGHWIDFTVAPLVHASLTLGPDDYRLKLEPTSQRTGAATAQLGQQSRPFTLRPQQTVELTFPRSHAEHETVEHLPLRVTAGELTFNTSWWVKSEYDMLTFATVPDQIEPGQCLRGQPERALDSHTGAGVYWTERSCDDEPRRCLFMHPPYMTGVGYSYALLQPVDLPSTGAAFRCDIGKADGSDPGDGILFRLAVIDSQGTETIVSQQTWTQHAWTPLQADLSRWKGQHIRIKLIADVGAADDSTGDWACWSNMRVESLERELVTTLWDHEVALSREAGPYSSVQVTRDDLPHLQSATLHYQGIGLQHGAPYVSTARVNGVALGELPAASGDEHGHVWSEASVPLSPEAIASLSEWTVVTVQNPGQDSFKIGHTWLELILQDGRRASSQITRTVFTQPASWRYAQGVGVPFGQEIILTLHIPLKQKATSQ